MVLITEIESCESESSGHDGEEDLRSGQSVGDLREEARHTYNSGSLFAPLFNTLPSALLAAALPACVAALAIGADMLR